MHCKTCGMESPPGAACVHCGTAMSEAATTIVPELSASRPAGVTAAAADARFAATTFARTVTATPTALGPGQQFGRYHILRLLGAGGMGTVYHAWDDELGMAVALKIVRPDTAVDATAREELQRRFKQEIILARQVTHTNVLRIHDLGEIDDLKYISMPYIEGADLDRRLHKEGRLPVVRALKFARQIAAGLVAAHAAGVVHRDLKPANAIVDHEDHLYLLDFGIARSLTAPAATMVVGAIGTIDYMAPEQAKGRAVDQRADIYAFGLIVYDLLVGRRRVESSDSAIAELMHRMEQPPVPLRMLDPSIPGPLEAIVARCVAPDPDKRFQHMTDVVAELDRLDEAGHVRVDAPAATIAYPSVRPARPRWLLASAVTATAAVVLLGAGAWYVRSARHVSASAASASREPVSVLIADFENKTGDAVFDGVVEQALGLGVEGASFITTYPRRDALRAAATIKPGSRLDEQTARLVALREGVTLVLAGAVEPASNGFRISTRTIDPVSAGSAVAEESVIAANKAGVLEAVGKMAGKVRAALGDPKAGYEQAGGAESFTAGSLEAAHAYAEAQDFQFIGDREKAIGRYEEAIRLDPDFGRAYAGIAAQLANLGRPLEAEKYYQSALARIDRMTDREKYRTRGSYYMFSRNAEKAVQEYEALTTAFPSDTIGHANLALARFYRRDLAGALEQNRRVSKIYPKYVTARNNGALYAMYAGQFESAIAEADEVLKLNPSYAKAFVARALSQLALGQNDAAAETWRKLAALPAGASMAALGQADLALFEGRTKDALAQLDPAIAADVDVKNLAAAATKRMALAQAYAKAGDAAAAVREADRAMALAPTDSVQFTAGQLYAQFGRAAQTGKLADALSGRLDADAQAYGRLLNAEVALAQKNPRAALDEIKGAQKIADTWPGRLLLARAYFELGAFAEASSELDIVQKRRGEATAMFLDDVPTYRVYAQVPHWVTRVQESLKSQARHTLP
jgi:tetratricopeptide (TPR) repeat protein